jgi:hypothetical protein
MQRIKEMWDLTGKVIAATYYGATVVGVVESSRLLPGGKVQHTVLLFESINSHWRDRSASRVVIDGTSESSIAILDDACRMETNNGQD